MTDELLLLDLAERCEKATAEEQLSLLSEAHYLIAGGSSLGMSLTSYRHWLPNNPFGKMLAVGAHESAALTLVPTGLFPLLDFSGPHCRLRARHAGRLCDVTNATGLAVTPALALCAASLRSRSTQGRDAG